jgi:hypothetical protein
LCVARSNGRAVGLGRWCQLAAVGKVARKSRAQRGGLEKASSEALSFRGVQRVHGRGSSHGDVEQRAKGVARSEVAETSSAAEPVVIHHGREAGVQHSDAQSRHHAGRWKRRLLVLETSGVRRRVATGWQDAECGLIPPSPEEPPADPAASKPDLVELNRSSTTRRSRSRTAEIRSTLESAQRTAVKLRPHQETEGLQEAKTEPVLPARARGRTPKQATRRGRLLQQLVGRRLIAATSESASP